MVGVPEGLSYFVNLYSCDVLSRQEDPKLFEFCSLVGSDVKQPLIPPRVFASMMLWDGDDRLVGVAKFHPGLLVPNWP